MNPTSQMTVIVMAACLLVCLLVGCGTDSADSPAAPTPTIDSATIDSQQLAAEIEKQMADQMKQRAVDLEKAKLILWVDGLRDSQHSQQIRETVQLLVDKSSGNWQVTTKGGFEDASRVEISPVADLEATAAKIDFGAVLGVDLAQRTIVVDAGAKAFPRPETGWPGADAVRDWKGRKLATGFLADARTNAEKLAAENAVIVGYPQRSPDEDAWANAIDAKLKQWAATSSADVSTRHSYRYDVDYRVATIKPVETFSALVKALADQVSWSDEQLRVIVLERRADEHQDVAEQELTQP